MAESSSRKRPLPGIDDDIYNNKPPQKRVRFPKGKKPKPGDEVADLAPQAEDVQNERTAAQRAAKERAALRRNEKPASEEDTDLLPDISRAEQHYEDNEIFVDDGIHIEPFNLSKEREEGYFDASGSYIEYLNKNVIKDAWLDNVEVVPRSAERSFAVTVDEDENVELTSQAIGMMKRRMADVLEPGETVLQALRRLKGTSTSKKEKMSAETTLIFDQLTEDAMRLMENGEYNVYEETKEVFQREAEGYEQLAQESGGDASTNSGKVVDAFDMFADDDEKDNANPASNRNDLVPGPSSGIGQPSESESLQNDFVYDESSGYYYSSSLGYYYDPSSGLYCFAESGQWFSYNEETMTYDEVQRTESATI